MTTTSSFPLTALTSAGSPRHALFATGDQALLGRVAETWTTSTSSSTGWADAVVAGLAPGEYAFVALSFEGDGPALAHRLSDAQVLSTAEVDEALHGVAPWPSPERTHRVTESPSAEQYGERVAQLVAAIEAGAVDKAVLGRHLDIVSSPALSGPEIVQRMLRTRPGRYVFSAPVGTGASSALVLGASPELLVRRRGGVVDAMPLAGSVPRSADPREDEQRRASLAASAKDLREHAFVVTDLAERLRESCDDVRVAPTEVVGTDALWHLGTRVTATAEPGTGASAGSALRLAQLLHPTPAVGGTPRGSALAHIAALEEGPRGWLAGAVGWVDSHGDGEFALTLRSGVLEGENLRLFAGAGIVAGSEPASEIRETGAKLRTMTEVIGL